MAGTVVYYSVGGESGGSVGEAYKTMSRQVSTAKRFAVLNRDKFTCQYCGRRGGELEVDHVVPYSRGGSDEMDNLVAACRSCNQGKSDDDAVPPEEFDDCEAPSNRPRRGLFVFHLRPDSAVDYIGEVREETADSFRVEVLDGMMATGLRNVVCQW
jgi:hypothetical protein